MQKEPLILGIESSCDDTGIAVLLGHRILSNVVANQEVHKKYGGVVPEIASRAHQKNIVPVMSEALAQAGIALDQLDAIAFTKGPGLLGSLLVGLSFAKSLCLSLGLPLVAVDHMQAHILAHFIEDEAAVKPEFPFLCLTISGGHTQLVKVKSPHEMEVLGQTLDDAVGEAYDKIAKMMGLTYPGGPLIDKYAQSGVPRFRFSKPKVGKMEFSFSGLKTGVLYFLRDELKKDSDFITKNLNDLCASLQHQITDILMEKIQNAVAHTGIKRVAIAGGVAANSEIRARLAKVAEEKAWHAYIPPRAYTTDNAAMVAMAGYFKYLKGDFCDLSVNAEPRLRF